MHKTHETTAAPAAYTGRIPNTPARFILAMARPHWKWAVAALLAVSVADILGTSLSFFLKSIIDSAQGAGAGAADGVLFWIGVYIGALALMFAFFRISGFTGMQFASRLNATAYTTLFSYISKHSHAYFSDRFAGSLSSKITHASEGSQSMTEASLWNYYPTILTLITTIIYMATVSPIAAGLFTGLLVVLLPLNIYLAKRRRPFVVQYSADATTARGHGVDAITNITAVRQYARRAHELSSFSELVHTMRTSNIRQWRMSEWTLLINNVIIVLFEASILLSVYMLWQQGSVSVGDMVMIVTLLMSVTGTLVFIGSSMNGFIRRYGEVEEGLTDILIDHEIVDAPDAKPLVVTDGTIAFSDVAFRYNTEDIFRSFTLTIPAGERVGLVGPSGAGKSTFVSLLLRQHELTGGQITIDGQDIAEVTQDSLRENVALVPQEPSLFHRTIRENIAYGRLDATQEEVETAAKRAQAHDFIMALPEGYDTLVGERGVKLSGGQRQRIAIARAMLKDAPILILDEATSSLDSESEAAIQTALHELMEGKTVIAIAHRLSTLREMDRLLVLQDGEIVQDGTHATLSKKAGLYKTLWEHQAGGFLQE